jgi:hypothetical protein
LIKRCYVVRHEQLWYRKSAHAPPPGSPSEVEAPQSSLRETKPDWRGCLVSDWG